MVAWGPSGFQFSPEYRDSRADPARNAWDSEKTSAGQSTPWLKSVWQTTLAREPRRPSRREGRWPGRPAVFASAPKYGPSLVKDKSVFFGYCYDWMFSECSSGANASTSVEALRREQSRCRHGRLLARQLRKTRPKVAYAQSC